MSCKIDSRVHFTTFLLKAGNTFFRKYFDNQTQSFILKYNSVSQAFVQWNIRQVWHETTYHLKKKQNTQTNKKKVAKECQKGKRKDTPVLLPEGRSDREREKRGRTGAEEEQSFEGDMLRDYTYRYNTLQSEQRQSSSRREKTEDRDWSSAKRKTMLGRVSMLAAQRNFTGSPRHSNHM